MRTSPANTNTPPPAAASIALAPRRPPARIHLLADLRRRIAEMERHTRADRPSPAGIAKDRDTAAPAWCFGVEDIDAFLPAAGLEIAALHEAAAASPGDGAAAAGFCLALLARLPTVCSGADRSGRRPVLWCQNRMAGTEAGRLYGPGLSRFGLTPGDLIIVDGRRDRDVLWAMEEGVCSRAVAAVVGEVSSPSFTATRRLSLASADTGVPSLIMPAAGPGAASAARSRWRIAAAPSTPAAYDPRAPGHARWRIALTRCRSGRSGEWTVDWDHETGSFHLAAAMADRQDETGRNPQAVGPARRHAV